MVAWRLLWAPAVSCRRGSWAASCTLVQQSAHRRGRQAPCAAPLSNCNLPAQRFPPPAALPARRPLQHLAHVPRCPAARPAGAPDAALGTARLLQVITHDEFSFVRASFFLTHHIEDDDFDFIDYSTAAMEEDFSQVGAPGARPPPRLPCVPAVWAAPLKRNCVLPGDRARARCRLASPPPLPRRSWASGRRAGRW